MRENPKYTSPKKGPSKLRQVSWGFGMVFIFAVTYFVYLEFGVGGGWAWFQDIMMLVFLVLLVIAAAALTVWILMLVRKKMGKL